MQNLSFAYLIIAIAIAIAFWQLRRRDEERPAGPQLDLRSDGEPLRARVTEIRETGAGQPSALASLLARRPATRYLVVAEAPHPQTHERLVFLSHPTRSYPRDLAPGREVTIFVDLAHPNRYQFEWE